MNLRFTALLFVSVLAVGVGFGVGCNKRESSPRAAQSAMKAETGAQTGEALWTRACTHALGVFAKLTGAPADKASRGRRACINGLRKAQPAKADQAARCFLKMKQMPDMVPCMKILFPDGKMPAHGKRRYR